MRIVDADILSYALVDNHIANPYVKPFILEALRGELEVYLADTTLLEAYNTLYWYYKVRPRGKLLRKLSVVARGLNLVSAPVRQALRIAVEENTPLGDALLVAAAIEERIPIVVSNDKHVRRLAEKYRLVYENPIPEEVRRKMGELELM
ncbi:MAG: hypothetical protein DRN99_03405 [Thermoproteota archaeon]|nr:MAG: hypothetical protein DRN99_03405 [Candidatus Korarchaeota archaeon]